MSFILDAVKKSEEQRRQGQQENLQSWYYSQPKDNRRGISRPLIALLVGLNLLLLVAVLMIVVSSLWPNSISIFDSSPLDRSISESSTMDTSANGVQADAPSPNNETTNNTQPQNVSDPRNNPNAEELIQPNNLSSTQPTSKATSTSTGSGSGAQTVNDQIASRSSQIQAPQTSPTRSNNPANTTNSASIDGLEPGFEVIKPRNQSASTPTNETSQTSTPNSAESKNNQNIDSIENLPKSMLVRIPALEFSSHLYSNMPSARQVVVNRVRLREGEYLDRNIQLIEINEQDIVFEMDNRQFRVLLARYWTASE